MSLFGLWVSLCSLFGPQLKGQSGYAKCDAFSHAARTHLWPCHQPALAAVEHLIQMTSCCYRMTPPGQVFTKPGNAGAICCTFKLQCIKTVRSTFWSQNNTGFKAPIADKPITFLFIMEHLLGLVAKCKTQTLLSDSEGNLMPEFSGNRVYRVFPLRLNIPVRSSERCDCSMTMSCV